MEYVKVDRTERCWQCGTPTDQIELCSEQFSCSDDCTQKYYDHFTEVCRALPPFTDPFNTYASEDQRNHRLYKEYLRLVGQPPPRTQHPNNTLPDLVLEKLRDRPDLVEWALGKN